MNATAKKPKKLTLSKETLRQLDAPVPALKKAA